MSNNEPIIKCPYCKKDIKLTESLAGPMVEQVKSTLATEYAAKLEKDVAEGAKKLIQKAAADARATMSTELVELQLTLSQRDAKLAEAQKAQAELIRKQRDFEDKEREMSLTIETKVSEARALVKSEIELRVSEKEQTIQSMKKQLDEMQRKVEQGSQQLQGEVQELELENLLRIKFPHDSIEPVGKGEFGGDVLQKVFNSASVLCGSILWESKRTKSWSDGWLPKLREDQRNAKADVAIIITQVLPKEIESFGTIDSVWIAKPRDAYPLCLALRHTLLEVGMARAMNDGIETKTEMMYTYLTGPRFRLRVGAIVEAFSGMKEDLEKERKVITKQWAKRDEQIERVMQSTVGMYGDLQGIAGKSIQEIEGLNIKEEKELGWQPESCH